MFNSTLSTCRFCKESSFDGDGMVKYGVRHYAHMRTESIKAFVQHRIKDGYSMQTIWKEAQARFPHKTVSWSYVCRIERETLESEQ